MKVDAPLGFIPSPAKLEIIRIQANRKTKNPGVPIGNTAPRIKTSTQSTNTSIPRRSNRTNVFSGLDLMDQNVPGFNDDMIGNDVDGDSHSLNKAKLAMAMSKDKKKTFFKKVKH